MDLVNCFVSIVVEISKIKICFHCLYLKVIIFTEIDNCLETLRYYRIEGTENMASESDVNTL